MPYNPTNWVEGQTTLGPANLNKMEAGIAAAMRKDGTATATGPQTHDRAAPDAGQVQPYWTYQQAGANKIRHAMDENGNLVFQRWTGSDWDSVLTFQVGASLVLASVDQVDGYHFRLTGQILEYSSNGTTWAPAGLPPNKIRAMIRRS